MKPTQETEARATEARAGERLVRAWTDLTHAEANEPTEQTAEAPNGEDRSGQPSLEKCASIKAQGESKRLALKNSGATEGQTTAIITEPKIGEAREVPPTAELQAGESGEARKVPPPELQAGERGEAREVPPTAPIGGGVTASERRGTLPDDPNTPVGNEWDEAACDCCGLSEPETGVCLAVCRCDAARNFREKYGESGLAPKPAPERTYEYIDEEYEENAKQCVESYRRVFGSPASAYVKRSILEYAKHVGAGAMEAAFERTAGAGSVKWNYIEKILRDFIAEGLRTRADAERREHERSGGAKWGMRKELTPEAKLDLERGIELLLADQNRRLMALHEAIGLPPYHGSLWGVGEGSSCAAAGEEVA